LIPGSHAHSATVIAATPAILQITPVLGVLIGVVAALVLVAVIIVVVMRLRGHGDEDVKEHEDGSGNSGRRGTPPGSDKASSMPLSKDMDESIESMDEKNPDIIPHNSGESELYSLTVLRVYISVRS
jgi:hypothetical protein